MYTHVLELFGHGIGPSQGNCSQDNTKTELAHIESDSSSMIQTLHLNVAVGACILGTDSLKFGPSVKLKNN
jgi:hypothetical protein